MLAGIYAVLGISALVAAYFGVGIVVCVWSQNRSARLRGSGLLAITYDDGPSPELTNKILDLLKEFDAKATFFVVGRNAEAHPTVIERIAAEGHTVGWHSMTHRHQWKTSPFRAWQDTANVPPILTSGSTRAKVYRPPYGKLNLLTVLAFLKLRFSSVHWTLVSGDTYPEVPDVDDVVKTLDNAGGGVILMHDMKRSSPDAEERNRFVLGLTRAILELRRRRGWKLVSATDV